MREGEGEVVEWMEWMPWLKDYGFSIVEVANYLWISCLSENFRGENQASSSYRRGRGEHSGYRGGYRGGRDARSGRSSRGRGRQSLKEVKQAMAIKHMVVVEDLEAEAEADFNNEIIENGTEMKRKLKGCFFYVVDADDDDDLNTQDKHRDDQTPLQSPTLITPTSTPSSSGSGGNSSSNSSGGAPMKMRSLNDIYDTAEPVQTTFDYSLFCLMAECDPVTYEEVTKDDKWKRAIYEEIAAIKRNNTRELTDLPKGHKEIGVKWVHKTKTNQERKMEKHKARLVAKGYKQKQGIDYDEVFALVARIDIIRLLIALAVQNKWKIYQMDVKLHS
ncbi:hypothetical protein RJ639_040700 [Escallonia herrerae]|uniref:Reverse transcriptase Ty1/copia-type domain-containing protein n=1 Tax=Escallonia herrerae TaxID=1293975 RepID=A0AA88WGI1_9ASTE|nr:hypothetical protein RJ639_040700 [Escallonia herrerae]